MSSTGQIISSYESRLERIIKIENHDKKLTNLMLADSYVELRNKQTSPITTTSSSSSSSSMLASNHNHDHLTENDNGSQEFYDDQENFLWFRCPICSAVFYKYEVKLMEHKWKVHGTSKKNRTAFIMSQADISPRVVLLKHDFKIPVYQSTSSLKPSLSQSRISENGILDSEDSDKILLTEIKVEVDADECEQQPEPEPSNCEFPFDDAAYSPENFTVDHHEVHCPVSSIDFSDSINSHGLRRLSSSRRRGMRSQEASNGVSGDKITRKKFYKTQESPLSDLQTEPQLPQLAEQKTNATRKVVARPRPYKCTICKRCYSTKAALAAHRSTFHNPARPDPTALTACPQCGKKLLNKSLPAHLLTHEQPEKNFLCSMCAKTFRLESLLRLHMNTVHLGKPAPRRLTCETCGYKTSTPSLLKIHQVKHQTERPFLCDLCPKSFKDLAGLKIHKQGHTGQRRKFPCTTCGQSFTLADILLAHQLLKHPAHGQPPEYKHECKICGKKFLIERYCAGHELRHYEAARKHECGFCGRKFIEPRRLRIHEELHRKGGRIQRKRKVTELEQIPVEAEAPTASDGQSQSASSSSSAPCPIPIRQDNYPDPGTV